MLQSLRMRQYRFRIRRQSRKKCNFPPVWQLQFPQIHLRQNQMKRQESQRTPEEKTGVEKKDVVLVTTSNDSESNLEEETDGSVETNTEVSESGQVEEVSGTSQAPAYNNRWNISLTDEEIDLLAKIVWLEANGEPVEGQEAVVEVVLNRMASDLYPDTLYDVLSQNNPVQFVSWKRRDKAHPTETEYQSIYNVLNGNTDLLRNDTMNFSTYPLTSNLDVKICCHYFCY